MKSIISLAFLLLLGLPSYAQPAQWNTPGAGNPILPGYFADPTIRKFGDTYYIYATTDGTGNGYGPPQVWLSKDFVNWRNVTMNWPTTEVVWAPDVVQQDDGSYRYYYCTPCEIRVGESDSPTGPWKNRLGKSDAVLVPDRFVHNAITLDPQLFVDDDGSEYLYFGTWGIYKGFGCGVAKLSDDGKSFTDKKLIENTEITDFFEAPYIFKKDGIYYFTYSSGSCHDATYRVQYAVSTSGPMGPYTYKGCILKTNSDETVHGPGHHSILVDGEDYYIVYHRHNLPRSIHGFHRQVCIDKLEFTETGEIKPVIPTHDGIIPKSLSSQKSQCVNLAFGAKTSASSEYSEWFRAAYATDDNNATLWRAKSCNDPAWLMLDLGDSKAFNEIFTQFEYATFFYQYKIELSDDGTTWRMYSDRSKNTQQGSPMIDTGAEKARYIRLTITDTQKNGHFPAIWNVKVYNATPEHDPLLMLPEVTIDENALLSGYPWIHTIDVVPYLDRSPTGWVDNLILDFNADDYTIGKSYKSIKNKGLTGNFESNSGIPVVPKNGKTAFYFDGSQTLRSTFSMPRTMVYNAPYTINAWLLNPEVDEMECVAQFMPVGNDLGTIEFRNGRNRNEGIIAHNASFENSGAPDAIKAGEWQFWSITYDGYMERIYCNGQKVSEKNNFLMLRPSIPIIIGNSSNGSNPFSGYLHSLEFYDKALDSDAILNCYHKPSDMSANQQQSISKLNLVSQGRFDIDITPISPESAIVKIKSDKGDSGNNGLLTYSFGLSETEMHTSSSDEMVVSLRKDMTTIYAQVHDLFGNSSPVIKKKCNWKSSFKDMAKEMNISPASDGKLTLSSDHSNLGAEKDENVALSTTTIEGDFVLQCKVTDLTGKSRRSTPSYNEGGVLLQCEDGSGRQSLIHLGVFPNYNCGNMLTIVRGGYRPQYKNNKGWDYDPYLQIERRGNKLHARTSPDGVLWTEMSNSPVDCSFMSGKALKAGFYQTTYSDNHAYVTFEEIKFWRPNP